MTDPQHLRDRIAELEEEVRQLRAITRSETQVLEMHFGLTQTEGRILRVLARGGVWSRDRLITLCCKMDTIDQGVTVHICKIRKKIAPLEIRNLWAAGYRIEGESLDTVRRIIAGELPAPRGIDEQARAVVA